jgi:methylated-DNA-[protein]-cysteine S-methyltransferase
VPEAFSYMLVPSAFGDLSVVWREDEPGPRVYRVFLPNPQSSAQDLARASYPDAGPGSCPVIAGVGERMRRFLAGEAVGFDLDAVTIERCSEFQRRVLLAEREIPRGWVSTYGTIASCLGVPRGARAVGNALSHNPFPIIIPCHRAIRSDGSLGGFQGGTEMKRALLGLEGIDVSPAGRVRTERVYYSKVSSF